MLHPLNTNYLYTMELSKQCITLEQSRKLLSLWFKKESYFDFISTDWRDFDIIERKEYPDDWSEYGQNYSAYTVSELMEYLPVTIDWPSKWQLRIIRDSKIIFSYYDNGTWWAVTAKWENLAQVLWDMLIYLIENKYISI